MANADMSARLMRLMRAEPQPQHRCAAYVVSRNFKIKLEKVYRKETKQERTGAQCTGG